MEEQMPIKIQQTTARVEIFFSADILPMDRYW